MSDGTTASTLRDGASTAESGDTERVSDQFTTIEDAVFEAEAIRFAPTDTIRDLIEL